MFMESGLHTSPEQSIFDVLDDDSAYKVIASMLLRNAYGPLGNESPATIDEETKTTDMGEPASVTESDKIFESIKRDIVESPKKSRTILLGSLALGTQVVDRARLGIVLVPHLAVATMEHTQNSILTGLVTGASLFAWNAIVGESFGRGLQKFPKTTKAFANKFPTFNESLTDALPGIETNIEDRKVDGSIRDKFRLHRRRAQAVMGIGTTAFVGTATLNGYTQRETSKVNLIASADGGAVGALVGFGASKAVMELANHGHLELANDIQNTVGDSRLWLGLAAVSMGAEFISSRKKRKNNS